MMAGSRMGRANEDAFELVEKINTLLADRNQKAIYSMLQKAWKVSKEVINKRTEHNHS